MTCSGISDVKQFAKRDKDKNVFSAEQVKVRENLVECPAEPITLWETAGGINKNSLSATVYSKPSIS